MGKNRNRNIAIVVILIIAVGAVAMTPAGQQFTADFVQMLEDGWNNLFGAGVITGKVAAQKFILYKRGTVTALADATVYAHYDWNGNGLVDLGEYPDGEIETLVSATTTGLVTTVLEYPVGRDALYQIHLATYEIETFARARDSIPAAHDGSALSVPACYITLTDTGVSRVSVNGELLVTASTDYNYTLSGANPSVEFVHTATSSDAGINEQAFTHWGTAKVYAGTFLGVIFLNQDFIDLNPDGYSGVFIGATNTYVWYFVDGYFNDAEITGDERYSLFHTLTITAAGDYANIGLYNGV